MHLTLFLQASAISAKRVNGSYLASSYSRTLSNKCILEECKGQEDTATKVIEATALKFDVRSDPGFKNPNSIK